MKAHNSLILAPFNVSFNSACLGHIPFAHWIVGLTQPDCIVELGVPDKRFCFDHFRPISRIADIIDSYHRKDITISPGTDIEQLLNCVRKGEHIAWSKDIQGRFSLMHPFSEARRKLNRLNSETCVDCHKRCFVPHSFRLLIEDLNQLGLIKLREAAFYPTEGCEFHIVLSRNGSGMTMSRLDALEIISDEIRYLQ